MRYDPKLMLIEPIIHFDLINLGAYIVAIFKITKIIEVKMTTVTVKDFKTKLSAFIKKINETGESILLTKHGKVVAKITPCDDRTAWEEIRKKMAGSVLKYDDPTEPVGLEEWESLK